MDTPDSKTTPIETTAHATQHSKPISSADQSKLFGVLGYVLPFLFFLPLVMEGKNDAFARYHANQQLNLLLFWLAGHAVATMLLFVLIGAFLLPLVSLATIIFMILGIINVVQGQMKPLPLIGQFKLLK